MPTFSHSMLCTLACFVVAVTAACSGSDAGRTTPTVTSDRATATPTLPSTPATSDRPLTTPEPASSQPHAVAISAGHGGPHNVGAVHKDAQGNADLVEK